MRNRDLVDRGFQYLLRALAPYMMVELKAAYGQYWWQVGVFDKLRPENRKDLNNTGDDEERIKSMDILLLLKVFDANWNEVFRKKLSIDHRTWGKELIGVRNKTAHVGYNDFDEDYAWRALDTMSRLSESLRPEAAEKIRELARTVRYGSAEGSTATKTVSKSEEARKVTATTAIASDGLVSWREVMEPHQDVAKGRYRNAEFAADLAQVARGDAEAEYQDPVEFFNRTYITDGMAGLLVQAMRRVSGGDGEPVIQLKTAFGGGKTHSMLALYHLLRKTVPYNKIKGADELLKQAGVDEVPKVNVAVLVGTALEPAKNRRPNNFPGITINTMWGEMAAQLAQSAGKPEAYDIIRASDRKGVSPGSDTLRRLLDTCGPCLVLMDEMVAYARKIYGVDDLPAGSFDNFITFVQEITEAARASKNSIVVASIPESNVEIGGEAGQIALASIEHTFGRMESIWKPVSSNESFEVVRRRLFLGCKDEAARDKTCEAFSKMYQQYANEFPIEAKEISYKERMVSCYPIHPEVFDRLYEEWATLERFQKTRGVLRLMAAVIHRLWMDADPSPMIMPGNLPMAVPEIRDELTRYLPDGWNAVVDKEVDGAESDPVHLEAGNVRYAKRQACRRLARTIFLGSAPSVREQDVRGIEKPRIRLGVVIPGENLSEFNDALNALQRTLSYLYTGSSGERLWYDTRPTLKKLAQDRARQVSVSDADYYIEKQLKKYKTIAPFRGIHCCPDTSLDVPDTQEVRLVLIKPKSAMEKNAGAALDIAKDIVNSRGDSPRTYKNMLVFLAADKGQIPDVRDAVKLHKAWESLMDERDSADYSQTQIREIQQNLEQCDTIVENRINSAWNTLFVPVIDLNDLGKIQWEFQNIGSDSQNPVERAVRYARSNEWVIETWGPMLLKLQLDQLLWASCNDIEIKKLWEQLTTYCYLPRLSDVSVLYNCILQGIASREYFAIAAGFSKGRYTDLRIQKSVLQIMPSDVLVKADVAEKQISDDEAAKTKEREPATTQYPNDDGESDTVKDPSKVDDSEKPKEKKAHRFYMTTQLDNLRVNRDVDSIIKEVVSHLENENGSKVTIRLDVQVDLPNGVGQDIERTVLENCSTLHVSDFGFEE